MAKPATFLVEIGTEELPPADLQNLSVTFATLLKTALQEHNIAFDQEHVQTFATPRRLAVLIPHVAAHQPEQTVAKRGPAIAAAYNADGSPTKAALGFAESCNVDIKDLTVQETDKGKWLYYSQVVPGSKTVELLPAIVEKALLQLPIKKRMRWGAGEFAFVRPIHWILMLFGEGVIKANICDIHSDNITYGHRIHHPKAIKIDVPEIYADRLEQEGYVIANFAERQETIKQEILRLAQAEKATPVIDPALLDLVTGLVEYPVALLAHFAAEFLRVPKECLISAMQDHQKCFALLDQQQNLVPKFILISNLKSTDPHTVIRGNELVMGARLADAAFHFDNDQKHTLESRVEKLKSIVYQKQLGSLYDKVMRIEQLAGIIAPFVNADITKTKRAAYLCKADLLTNMVYEFPELQGIMGYYYALHDKEPTEVAIAIQEHYKPRGASDTLPESYIGIALALADRLDSLVGFFGIGNIPTGEKDPFALRRQALAVLRILIEKKINIDLRALFTHAAHAYADKIKDPTNDLMCFCYDRLKAWYLANGIHARTFDAVLFNNPNSPLDFDKRINAVSAFQKLPAAESLAAANKRVHNLLEKNPLAITGKQVEVNVQLISAPEEKQLLTDVQNKETEIAPLMQQADYAAVLKSLAALQKPVDNFFDKVMVMVDDEKVRNNRLNLLQRLRNLFLQVADISLL